MLIIGAALAQANASQVPKLLGRIWHGTLHFGALAHGRALLGRGVIKKVTPFN